MSDETFKQLSWDAKYYECAVLARGWLYHCMFCFAGSILSYTWKKGNKKQNKTKQNKTKRKNKQAKKECCWEATSNVANAMPKWKENKVIAGARWLMYQRLTTWKQETMGKRGVSTDIPANCLRNEPTHMKGAGMLVVSLRETVKTIPLEQDPAYQKKEKWWSLSYIAPILSGVKNWAKDSNFLGLFHKPDASFVQTE